MSQHKHTPQSHLQDAVFLLLGILSASFALKGFMVPNHFLDGGVTGISLLLHEVLHWNLGLLLILLNIPFIFIGWKLVGKLFAIRTSLAVIGVTLCLQYFDFYEMTHDKLLVATFGGFFLGLGIGLCMRGGGAFDGIEILALFTLKKTGFTITEIILGINIVTFIIAG